MKKILLTLALGIFGLSAAQYYPSTGGQSQYESGWYGDEDHYFDDDYYYEYPQDYYSDDYYRSFYNDYRQSISRVNWNRLFRDLRLNAWQVNMIIELNNQFPDYYTWNSYYNSNPSRWYYDRFYAMEQILGSRGFNLYRNNYYNGRSPVQFYVNLWRTNYRPRYYTHYVRPRYRQVNINVYRVDRRNYHRATGNQYGWNQPRNSNNARFNSSSNSNSTLRNSSVSSSTQSSARSNGFKSSTSSSAASQRPSGLRTGTAPKAQAQRVSSNSTRPSTGFRKNTPAARTTSPSASRAPANTSSSNRSQARSARSSSSPAKAVSSSSSSNRSSGLRGSR